MRNIFITTVSAGLIVLATAGCSPPTPSEPPPTSVKAQAMSQGQLCDMLATFFRDELHVVDLQTQPLRAPETILSSGGICEVAQGDKSLGRWESLRTTTRSDPTEGVRGFQEMTGVEHPVFVFDRRDDGFGIRMATRVGEWNARLFVFLGGFPVDIRTTDGLLDVDEKNMHKAAEFLVELTRKLASMPQ